MRLGDDAVDELYGRTLRDMMDVHDEAPRRDPEAIRVIKVAKYLERVADHATNIAEEVIFMVRGEDVRHVRTHRPPKVESSSEVHVVPPGPGHPGSIKGQA